MTSQNKLDAHPFMIWYAYMTKRRFCLTSGSDIILNDAGSVRFTVGYEENAGSKKPILGINIFDKDAMTSIRWNAAAMVSGRQLRDWVALACSDIRVEDSSQQNAIPLRVWIPVPLGSFDRFKAGKTCDLLLKRYKNGRNQFPNFEKTPFLTLPMQFRDEWPKDLD
jgi:hypothetical protein